MSCCGAHESCCAAMRTALCHPLSSVPPLLSGPSHPASPLPSPPSVLKSFEAQMLADSGYFSPRPRQFYVSQALNTHRTEAYRVIMNPNTFEGRARPGHPGTCQYCHGLYSSARRLCGRAICVSEGGFTGLRPPASQAYNCGLWIAGGPMSRLLA